MHVQAGGSDLERWFTKYQRLVWIVVSALLLVPLAGCGERATPTPEPRTIQFVLYDYPSQQVAPYQRLADEFQAAHPETTIKIVTASGSGSLRMALEAGADVVLAWGWALDDVGELRPLDPFLETAPAGFLDDYLPRAIDAVRYQGQIIALPADLDVLVLYFNQDLFDQAGVPYPAPGWTWNDFVATAQAMTRPAEDGIQYGFYPSNALPSYLPFIAQEVSALWGDDLLNPEAMRLDSEPIARAIEWYADLALAYGVTPTPSEQRRLLADPIVLGRAPMWLGWSAERGGRQNDIEWKFRWGVAPLPRGSSGRTLATMAMYTIPTTARHPEDAWRWIAFIADRSETASGLPVRRSLLQDKQFVEAVGAERAPIFAQAAQDAVLVAPGPEFQIYATSLEQAVTEILEGGAPVSEALRKAQQRVEARGF
jgi:multiple sugar transport system substrate-binding protein